MSTPKFHALDRRTFRDVVERFHFRRKILEVHLHHTFRPNRAQYRGLETIHGMWRFHTQEKGWSDIAQHVSIAPDGTIWTGRSWNRAPASASGFNGSSAAGPFMIEMIGDFDAGRDRLEGEQLRATLEVIAAVQLRCGLDEGKLRFHREMSSKSCPGSGVDLEGLLDGLRRVREELATARREAPGTGLAPFDASTLAIHEVIESLDREAGARAAEPGDAELAEEGEGARWFSVLGTPAEAGRGGEAEITPEVLEELAPHLVNLNQGRFSVAGKARTSAGDVDRMFDVHLERELAAARERDGKLRIVFFAHGGLVSEEGGLRVAHKHVQWWKDNGVYPVYFTWETGLVETLRTLLGGGQRALAPNGAARAIQDPFLEELARVLGGVKVWGGMKRSAERAADPPPKANGKEKERREEAGGAWYTASRLKAFLERHPEDAGRIELHAVGHSAGSIFHSWFLPAALDLGVPPFESVHFLAPAIRVDEFHRRLSGRLGRKGLRHLSIYTMTRHFERADKCGGIYHKSLLYLIHHALEPERETPILGLRDSLLEDETLKRVFALDGRPSAVGEVIFSKSASESGRSASRSTTHGGFDDDRPTMESVVRRVLGKSDTEPLARRYPQEAGRFLDPWTAPMSFSFPDLFAPAPALSTPAFAAFPPPTPSVPIPPPAVSVSSGGSGGRKRALCVGIDDYPTAPLHGCRNDARLWSEVLGDLGFETTALFDGEATRSGILEALEGLIAAGREGDVLVFQFAGHGTQLRDASSDEDDAKDEALCAHDFATGAFVIDDDLAEVFARVGDGVNLTCFIDCCHSGTITRLAVGGQGRPVGGQVATRHLQATPQMQQAHERFRQERGLRRAGTRDAFAAGMKEVTFSACQPHEVAYEVDGQGQFTRHATAILRSGADGVSHRAFQDRVIAAFGAQGRQRPFLHCAPEAEQRRLLEPIHGAGGSAGSRAAGAGSQAPGPRQALLAETLRAVADLLQPEK
jgi:hypothetical protein